MTSRAHSLAPPAWSKALPLEDAFRMPTRPGSHTVYLEGEDLVVDWYDYGEHAPYESVNKLIFDQQQQAPLLDALGLPEDLAPVELARSLAERFSSYFAVRAFANAQGLTYRHKVDFHP